MSKIDQIANEVLTLIEALETELLSWGFVSGAVDLEKELPSLLSRLPEPIAAVWRDEHQADLSADGVLKNLVDRRLIFSLQEGGYRTRFAETVRLTFLLRQRFKENDWHTAPRLVSDMRLQLQRRSYPKRDIPLQQLVNKLERTGIISEAIETIQQLLTEGDGRTLNLARFQEEAVLHQLDDLKASRDKGVVIGAGTGSGKTKAFYIPALTHIVQEIDGSKPSLKVLTIYPRKELLKDQLAEAFAEARKLDHLLGQRGKRKISLGAYYGDVPESAEALQRRPKQYGWEKKATGYTCPFFRCPNGDTHVLVWELRDFQAEVAANKKGEFGHHTKLRCQTCDFETQPEELALTRRQLREKPPDILFTSTEMLNRHLGDAFDHALFGLGGLSDPPRLLLLDEIHTYEDIHGAQVAYLLRRWRHARGHARGKNLCMVGLSATLTNAEEFFAKLTGISPAHIRYIAPKAEDLTEEGAEYNLVLKGDPASGTSLLSTSVQTAMLIGRILDPFNNPISTGAYGHRIFAFTDKLDVINRWYHIMYDAEKQKRLSRLRESAGADELAKRRAQGQVWEICERLGYDLSQPLPLSRTTSQDPGVSQQTKLVIATSTLEVGFNDPRVGAVLQHKGPRSSASFLQRKGRAGRVRTMRPWTVVVTSGYGRDRWAFQHAEMLFSPLLPALNLPIDNYYVRKIQGAYVLMDWASLILLKERGVRANVWELLSASYQSNRYAAPRRHLCRLLLDVLEGRRRDDLERYLKNALSLDDDNDLEQILWDEPRSLYLEVIPTLVRQLETDWAQTSRMRGRRWLDEKWKDRVTWRPMPDFVPHALFADLNLPEVTVIVPPPPRKQGRADQEPKTEPMELGQVLTEFAPGRANKRFMLEHRSDKAHWLSLPDVAQLSRGVISLELLDIIFDEEPSLSLKEGDRFVRIFRPYEYRLANLPDEILSTSYAELIWRSHFSLPPVTSVSTVKNGAMISLPSRSLWRPFFSEIWVHRHDANTGVAVTRFAIGVKTETRFRQGGSIRRRLLFEQADKSAAIGYTYTVDALQFSFEPLDINALKQLDEWRDLYRHFSPEFFRTKLHRDIRLTQLELSDFTIDWLWQLELSMLTATAIGLQIDLASAAEEVNRNREAFAQRTLKVIFQALAIDDDGEEEEQGRLFTRLLELLRDPIVIGVLREAEYVLWNESDGDLPDWLTECYQSSLGATLFAALTRLVPDIDSDQLTMDVDGTSIWITENAAGGVGLISRIAEVISRTPRDLELVLRDTIEYCDRQVLAQQLKDIAFRLENDRELQQVFERVRQQRDLSSLMRSKEELAEVLENGGALVSRQLLVALNSKFLRPNSDSDSDRLLLELVRNWNQESERLNVAIDLRVMAVAARRISTLNAEINALLTRIGGSTSVPEDQVFNLLQSLLWLDCHDSCPDCIEYHQRYQVLVRPSRALLQALLLSKDQTITYGSADWETSARRKLGEEYAVRIRCNPGELTACKQALSHFITTPIDIGYQHQYPTVERIVQDDSDWIVELAVRELVGG